MSKFIFTVKVAYAMNVEINRLSVLVEDFDRPFHPDEMVLRVYKKVGVFYVTMSVEMCNYVKCSGELIGNLNH